jgi:hypothetical protein
MNAASMLNKRDLTSGEWDAVRTHFTCLDHATWELEMLLLRTMPVGSRAIRTLRQNRILAKDLKGLFLEQCPAETGPFRDTSIAGGVAALRRAADGLERAGRTPLPDIEVRT